MPSPNSRDAFHTAAVAYGRDLAPRQPLARTGLLEIRADLVRWIRPGVVEQFSVSMNGVRQDFLISERPPGLGALQLDIEIKGACLEGAMDGARFILNGTGRRLAYTRLHVTDAEGRVLEASIEVVSASMLRVRVDDTAALYPVVIDPTFSDEDWSSLGGIPGVAGGIGRVRAAAVDGSGNLYIGGHFTSVGDVQASNIAKWDGNRWSALGSGFNGEVKALAISGSDLYAGGQFDRSGSLLVSRVAKWDGLSWSALGTGVKSTVSGLLDGQMRTVNTEVEALAVFNTHLYVAGKFDKVGEIPANNIARWDGKAWFALGEGVQHKDSPLFASARALTVSGSSLYVGGAFDQAGAVSATGLAMWNGNTWGALGSGVSDVQALATSGSSLYVGGSFSAAGGVPANFIAKWDGSNWSALGQGLDSSVNVIVVSGNDIYAGGNFTRADGMPANGVAKWNGSSWSALDSAVSGPGFSKEVRALAIAGTHLYVAGDFTTAGGISALGIAKWDGNNWSALGGGGLSREVNAMAVLENQLFVGHSRTSETNPHYIMKWDGTKWLPVEGLNGGVLALATSAGNLYAGGWFTTAGGIPAKSVAKWDGIRWSPLDSGLDGTVMALVASGDHVFAGGQFSNAGGIPAKSVAKWDGSRWSALGEGVDGSVSALVLAGSTLYIGGRFTTAAGIAANHVAKWQDNNWFPLGEGVKHTIWPTLVGVNALAISGGELYVGGRFDTAGSTSASSIAKWDGNQWRALSSGVNGEVMALTVSGNNLYVGGNFNDIGNRIVKWDQKSWSRLGSGVSDQVQALAVSGNKLYLGGKFLTAGLKPSAYAAIAAIDPVPTISVITPASGVQGSTVSAVLQGTGLSGASSVTFTGNGVTAVIGTGGTDTALPITITVALDATLEDRSVRVTTPGGTSAALAGFEVKVAAPSIVSLTPNSGGRDAIISATITGTKLSGATTVTFSGTGLTATIGSGGTDTTLPITIIVAADAEPGMRSLTVTTAGGTSAPFGSFTVIGPPLIMEIIPAWAARGTTVTAVITGMSLAGATDADFSGDEITAKIEAGGTDSSLPVSITIGANATPGNRTVTVRTPAGLSKPFSSFTVLSEPRISAISPTSGRQGNAIAAVLSGSYLAGATAVRFSGNGVTAVIRDGGTETDLPITISVAIDAALGERSIQVTTPGGVSAPFSGFTIRVPEVNLGIISENGTVLRNPDSVMYDVGSTVELTAVPDAGYKFVNWAGDLSGSENPVTIMLTRNSSVTAIFKPFFLFGIVSDARTGEPLPGVAISTGAFSTTTDDTGRWEFSGQAGRGPVLPTGSYALTFSKTGYSQQTQLVTLPLLVDAPLLVQLAGLPQLALEQPNFRDFGPVALGASSQLSFTIRNMGFADLQSLTISNAGPHTTSFTILDPAAPTVAPGGKTSFTIAFTPVSAGVKSNLFRIYSNDPENNPLDLQLVGTGRLEGKFVGGDVETSAPSFVTAAFRVTTAGGDGIVFPRESIERGDLFIVTEDGSPLSPSESFLQIASFGEVPAVIRTVLMLDNSFSVVRELPAIRRAGQRIVQEAVPGQEFAIYSFSGTNVLLQDFTSDKSRLLAAISAISIGGPSTDLYGSIVDGLGRWNDSTSLSGVTRGFLIALTDGRDTASRKTLDQVLSARGDKQIFTIGLGSEIEPDKLGQIGNAGFLAVAEADLESAFASIQQKIIQDANSFY
ncbi:MAG: choice-of-anchor D domain-containing protein, partial [Verrucomicrobiota bacterium]